MNHSFNIEIASVLGLRQAILLENIMFWTLKDSENGTNYHDGRYWVYNSISAWVNLFPYMSQKNIRDTLQSLIDQGILITSNYNTAKFDRTLWYSVTDKGLALYNLAFDQMGKCICPTGQMELPNRANGVAPQGKPIPVIINTDINHYNQDINKGDSELFSDVEEVLRPKLNNRFRKPTIEEVESYCSSRCNGISADAFINYYESVGWKVGNKPMKDWKAAIRTWERNGHNNSNRSSGRMSDSGNQTIGDSSRRTYAENGRGEYNDFKDALSAILSGNCTP